MRKPNVIQIGNRRRLDATQQEAVAYVVEKYGPVDARAAADKFKHLFPDVPVPSNIPLLMRAALRDGQIGQVSRGVYAAA